MKTFFYFASAVVPAPLLALALYLGCTNIQPEAERPTCQSTCRDLGIRTYRERLDWCMCVGRDRAIVFTEGRPVVVPKERP